MYPIRPVTLADTYAIYQLERAIFPQDAYPIFDLGLLLLTPGTVNLKAVNAAEKLIGFVCGVRVLLPGTQRAWIVTLGVAQAYQNQGIGKQLLLACEERLKRQRMLLTVRKSNQPAIHLYENSGYKLLYTRFGYYRDGEDGLIMEKMR